MAVEKKRILLLSAPFLPEYMRNARCDFVSLSATQWYPILLGMCGAFLEQHGVEVRLLDAPAHGWNHAQTRQLIHRFRPHILAVYTGRMSEKNDIAFADEVVGQEGCKAVLVGPYVSIAPEKALRLARNVRWAVDGEFELPLLELAAGKNPEEIRNLVFRDSDDQIRKNPLRPYLQGSALETRPFVSDFLRRNVDIRMYRTPSEFFPFMDIMTGRGCKWGHCTYCLWVHSFVKGMTYNVRSVPHVIEEFRFIQREMPEIRSVMIQDDTFTDERAAGFSEAYLQAGLSLPWSCYARADMKPGTLRLMRRANCRNLHVGYESADPDVLRRIKKGITLGQMERFTIAAKQAGLRIHGDFAFGFPGETPEAANRTIRWACRMNPHTAQFQLMIPFPGTPYFEEMKENGWLNAQGEPDMPFFSNAQIRQTAKRAYRAFYLSPRHLLKCVREPREMIFSRWKTILRAIPALFWQRWQLGS